MRNRILTLLIAVPFLLVLFCAFGPFQGPGSIPLYDPDAVTYQRRVIADGGTVISMNDVDAAIRHAKANGYWGSVAFWVSAQFGVKKDAANAVSVLYDLKGNDATQATGALQPTWSANQKNGRASVAFIQTSSQVLASAYTFPTNAMTCFLVWSAANADAIAFGQVSTNRWYVGGITNLTSKFWFGRGVSTDGTGTGTLNSWYLSDQILATSSTAGLRVNGATDTAIAAFTGTTGGGTLYVGAAGGGSSNFFSGKISEGIVISSALSLSVRQAIESFQNQKWAIY